jgi:serine phosphatase RsbU (regulator of sigma subunit)
MTTDEMVVDLSQDWVLACEVQPGFMQAPCTASDSLDYRARCRQVRALGGDCYNFVPLKSKPLGVGRCRRLGQTRLLGDPLLTEGSRGNLTR